MDNVGKYSCMDISLNTKEASTEATTRIFVASEGWILGMLDTLKMSASSES